MALSIPGPFIQPPSQSPGSVTLHFSVGQRVKEQNYNGKWKWVPGIVSAQLGHLSHEVEIGPNLVWCQHTDQIKDSNVPVADNHTPVIQPLLFPPPVEYDGDQEARSHPTGHGFSAIQSSV